MDTQSLSPVGEIVSSTVYITTHPALLQVGYQASTMYYALNACVVFHEMDLEETSWRRPVARSKVTLADMTLQPVNQPQL